MIKQLEIHLVKFPFSDLSDFKVRPVVVISQDIFNSKNNDVIIIPMTSNIKESPYSINVTTKDLESGFLYEKSSIRIDKIFTCNRDLFLKKIGILQRRHIEKIREIIFNLI